MTEKDQTLLASKLLSDDQLIELALEAIGKFTNTKDRDELEKFFIFNQELFDRL